VIVPQPDLAEVSVETLWNTGLNQGQTGWAHRGYPIRVERCLNNKGANPPETALHARNHQSNQATSGNHVGYERDPKAAFCSYAADRDRPFLARLRAPKLRHSPPKIQPSTALSKLTVSPSHSPSFSPPPSPCPSTPSARSSPPRSSGSHPQTSLRPSISYNRLLSRPST
jgi:hypothetical protein